MARTTKTAPASAPASRIVVNGVEYVLASTVAASSETSQHYADRDLPCTNAKPCTKTFRTESGQSWHAANVKHA